MNKLENLTIKTMLPILQHAHEEGYNMTINRFLKSFEGTFETLTDWLKYRDPSYIEGDEESESRIKRDAFILESGSWTTQEAEVMEMFFYYWDADSQKYYCFCFL